MVSHALLQATGQDRTGIYVAVAILVAFGLLGVYFLVRSKFEERRGDYERQASYVLGRGAHPKLVQVSDGEVVPTSTHELGREGLQALVHKVENRNDMGIEFLVLDDGNKVPYVLAKASLDRVAQVILSDSRGEITLDTDGRVTARPPLDPAVRRDLEALMVDVIEPDKEVHRRP